MSTEISFPSGLSSWSLELTSNILSAYLNIAWLHVSILTYIFKAQCLTKHRSIFTCIYISIYIYILYITIYEYICVYKCTRMRVFVFVCVCALAWLVC
jgi:hypothetical protein